RSGADRRLVDEDHIGEQLLPYDVMAGTGNANWFAFAFLQTTIQNLLDQGGLARAGDAGETHHAAERNLNINILQIIGRCAQDFHIVARSGHTPVWWHGNLLETRQILAGQGMLVAQQLGVGPGKNDLSTLLAGKRPQVKNVVRLSDDLR